MTRIFWKPCLWIRLWFFFMSCMRPRAHGNVATKITSPHTHIALLMTLFTLQNLPPTFMSSSCSFLFISFFVKFHPDIYYMPSYNYSIDRSFLTFCDCSFGIRIMGTFLRLAKTVWRNFDLNILIYTSCTSLLLQDTLVNPWLPFYPILVFSVVYEDKLYFPLSYFTPSMSISAVCDYYWSNLLWKTLTCFLLLMECTFYICKGYYTGVQIQILLNADKKKIRIGWIHHSLWVHKEMDLLDKHYLIV